VILQPSDGRSSRPTGCPWSAGATWPQPPPERIPIHQPGPQPTPPLAQHGLRQLRPSQPRLGQSTGLLAIRQATTPKSARPNRGLPRRTDVPTNPAVRTGRTRTRDARTRTPAHRTPGTGRADTGHPAPDARTPDTRHRTRGHRTPGTGHPAPDERTPDTVTGRGQATTAGHPGHPRQPRPRSRPAGRRALLLWAALAGSATNDGSEMGHRQRDRDNRSDQASARVRSTVQGARLGALLSLDDFGLRVERAESCHPLWRDVLRGVGVGWSQAGGSRFLGWRSMADGAQRTRPASRVSSGPLPTRRTVGWRCRGLAVM
jgi:hypothetical protein